MKNIENKVEKKEKSLELTSGEVASAKALYDLESIKQHSRTPPFDKQLTLHNEEIMRETERIRKELEDTDMDNMSPEMQVAFFRQHIDKIQDDLSELKKQKKTLKYLLFPGYKTSLLENQVNLEEDLKIAKSNLNFLEVNNLIAIGSSSLKPTYLLPL